MTLESCRAHNPLSASVNQIKRYVKPIVRKKVNKNRWHFTQLFSQITNHSIIVRNNCFRKCLTRFVQNSWHFQAIKAFYFIDCISWTRSLLAIGRPTSDQWLSLGLNGWLPICIWFVGVNRGPKAEQKKELFFDELFNEWSEKPIYELEKHCKPFGAQLKYSLISDIMSESYSVFKPFLIT